ncbi:MAG: hypothetical protein KAQ69_06155 [Spirochaetales bacterium]|nr:hypothetical protein [Spirochaetales bacterium]
MPTYDYICENCSHEFELFQGMKEDAETSCPECCGFVRRIISGGTGIIFKGSGFYVTDNKSKGSDTNTNPKTEPNKEKVSEKKKETAASDKK